MPTFLKLFLASSLVCSSASAQLTTGTITGTVAHQSGEAIPGAMITMKNVATEVGRSTQTGPRGRYEELTCPSEYMK
jgi:hypothetical protein